jgi:hypothetical protein
MIVNKFLDGHLVTKYKCGWCWLYCSWDWGCSRD